MTGWNGWNWLLDEAGEMRMTLVALPWPIEGAIWGCCWWVNIAMGAEDVVMVIGAEIIWCWTDGIWCWTCCNWGCAGRTSSGRMTCECERLYSTGLGVLLFLYFELSPWAAASPAPIGMKTFCRLPTETGDWFGINDGDPWPVGDEKAGVAERELLSDTRETIRKKRKQISHRGTYFPFTSKAFTQTIPIQFRETRIQIKIHRSSTYVLSSVLLNVNYTARFIGIPFFSIEHSNKFDKTKLSDRRNENKQNKINARGRKE